MINKTKQILDAVLKDIKPDETPLKIAKEFIEKLNKKLKQKKIDAEAVLGGSMAKNTFLKGDYDADIFIKFNKNYKGKNISKILENALKNDYEYERVKGSRDYFHVKNKFLFELVPVLDVTTIKEAENVIDMSPMHVAYFKNKGTGLEDEVRLLKKFMKANRVYGAESFINGFSGHVVDLLIVKYKSFIEVLKATKKWKTPIIIDVEKKLKNPLIELDKSKISGPIIIVDPVQENRNAAAALGFECYNEFVKAANNFLETPNEKYFVFKKAKEKILEQGKGHIYTLTIQPLQGSEDIAGAKILKALEHITRELKNNDFKTLGLEWDFGSTCEAFIVLENEELEELKIIKGPPLNSKIHCDAFKKKHKEVFEKNNYLHAKTKRTFTNARTLIEFLITNTYVKERTKNIALVS